ncbi:MAG: 50S ribosomal protein L1 [Deltaproteobacteria bacterium]|nr:50S ribosomal protein L1 [Deltaproteobacteria bacterium]
MKRGKKYLAKVEKVDRNKRYSPIDAMKLVKELSTAKFEETVDVAVRLGVDPRHADQMIRGAVVLPHGVGKTKRVAVFCRGDKQKEAREAGADAIGAEDLVQKVQEGFLDFDVAIATPDMMALVGRLGRVLGPRGLMPNPKTGTVTTEIGKAVSDSKGGKVQYRTEKAGIVQCPIGKVSFDPEKLLANFSTVLEALARAKPSSAKGTYMRSVTVSSTMGPGIKVDSSDYVK